MTESTDKKNITTMVVSILEANKIDREANLKLEIDLIQAWHLYVCARDEKLTSAESRLKVAERFNWGDNEVTTARARMTQLLMDTLGVDVNENNDDWQAVISHCIEAEKKGETVAMFRAWMNADPYNSPKKHQIAQSPMIIKKVWRSAFENVSNKPKQEEGKSSGYYA